MIFMEKFMKNITKMFLFILSFYLVLGSLWIGKDVIIHYQNIDGLPILGYHGVLEDKDKEKEECKKEEIVYLQIKPAVQERHGGCHTNKYRKVWQDVEDH